MSVLRAIVDKDNVILAKLSKSTSFKPGNEVFKIQVHPKDSFKTASIGTSVDAKLECALHDVLPENWAVFAWHPSDMHEFRGTSRTIA